MNEFPVDIVKIDQSFVRDLQPKAGSIFLVNAIMEVAKSLRLDVIAEGVETPEQQSLLSKLGCVHSQGYLFSEPLPADAFAAAQIQSFNLYLCATVHVAHAHKLRGTRWADDPAAIAEMKRKVPETMGACFAMIETHLLRGPWAMGERFSICDPYLFVFAEWLEGDGVDPARFPKVLDHRARMAARPSVGRVNASYAT